MTKTADEERYAGMIEEYFAAFKTGDFSDVKFSSKIQFLSPIIMKTFDGPEAVINFVSDVATRVSEVNILSILWPMFDPKAIMEHPDYLVPWLTGNGY